MTFEIRRLYFTRNLKKFQTTKLIFTTSSTNKLLALAPPPSILSYTRISSHLNSKNRSHPPDPEFTFSLLLK